MIKRYKNERELRRTRIRAKIKGSPSTPRVSVFRSNKHIYAQLIDDASGNTILQVSEKDIQSKVKMTKTEISTELGKKLGTAAIGKNIKKVVFDRGGFKYHGRVKALAEAARSEGLEF